MSGELTIVGGRHIIDVHVDLLCLHSQSDFIEEETLKVRAKEEINLASRFSRSRDVQQRTDRHQS